MKKIVLSITPEQEKYLKDFARLHQPGSEENLATRKPIHIVEEKNEELGVYLPVAYFFIRKEAERYKEYQRHNLNNPRIYTSTSGYNNNGEFEHFYQVLLNAGVKLHQGEKHKEVDYPHLCTLIKRWTDENEGIETGGLKELSKVLADAIADVDQFLKRRLAEEDQLSRQLTEQANYDLCRDLGHYLEEVVNNDEVVIYVCHDCEQTVTDFKNQ